MSTSNQATSKRFVISIKNMRCGSCANLLKKYPGSKTSCADEGVLPTSKACQYYMPEYTHMIATQDKVNPILQLIEAIRNTPVNLMQHMAYLMISAERIQRFLDMGSGRFGLLQKVYYRYRGLGDYLSNYCWAYVLDATADFVVLLAKSGEMIVRIDWQCAKSLLTEEEFAELREEMVASRNLYDPELDSYALRLIRAQMRSTATKDNSHGEIDLNTAINSGEVKKEVIEKANLADLFEELGTSGTVGKTHDKERFKDVVAKHREKRASGQEVKPLRLAFNGDEEEIPPEEIEGDGDEDGGSTTRAAYTGDEEADAIEA